MIGKNTISTAAGNDMEPIRTSLTEEDGLDFTIIELLFFAYRDFTSDPDQLLSQYGFGRAHHRVVHFVSRRPGLTVAELLDVLKITKQSLARVLRQLIDTGHIVQVQGQHDRRQRQLFPTARGRALVMEMATPQTRRIANALAEAEPGERAAIERFLMAMVNPELRAQIAAPSGNLAQGVTHDEPAPDNNAENEQEQQSGEARAESASPEI